MQFNNRVTVYAVDGADVRTLAASFARLTGGVTVDRAEGGWFKANGTYVQEPVSRVSAWFSPMDRSTIDTIVYNFKEQEFGRGEEAVLVEYVDGQYAVQSARIFFKE